MPSGNLQRPGVDVALETTDASPPDTNDDGGMIMAFKGFGVRSRSGSVDHAVPRLTGGDDLQNKEGLVSTRKTCAVGWREGMGVS